ncbi:MAG: isoprenylcysteine carboxylmethyltransferase family protein [Planctomycetes bacterium]|nr:isoprenylcysteine carboxylmethyltransferase family protein [Planctomycetota bacterium]
MENSGYYIGSGALAVLGIYCWVGMKKAYEKGEALPLRVSVAIWAADTVHALLVAFSSAYGVWLLPVSKMAAQIGGWVVFGAGVAIMSAGMIEFRSLRRMSGLDTSKFVTTGIYRWSRNPQYLGWFLALLGVSLAGRSGLAFLFSAALVVSIHLYTVRLEEPYLGRIFGEDYRLYKSRTARYVGIAKGDFLPSS